MLEVTGTAAATGPPVALAPPPNPAYDEVESPPLPEINFLRAREALTLLLLLLFILALETVTPGAPPALIFTNCTMLVDPMPDRSEAGTAGKAVAVPWALVSGSNDCKLPVGGGVIIRMIPAPEGLDFPVVGVLLLLARGEVPVPAPNCITASCCVPSDVVIKPPPPMVSVLSS